MHWCCSELIVHTNAGITVKCLLSDVWYFTFLQSLFFLRWNYMCLGIEPLLIYRFLQQLTRSRTVYCITRCKKIIEHTGTILYCSIVTIWVHFKRNHNLSDQVLINVLLLYCFLFIWIDRNYFLLQAWPKLAYLWSHERFIIWWIYWLKIKHIYIFII